MTIAPPTRYVFAFEVLPTDVFDNIVGFLLGWDLFYLSHASPWLLQALNHEEIWLNRVIRTSQTSANAKREYVQARAWCFQSQREDSSGRVSRGGGIKVDSHHLHRGFPGGLSLDFPPGPRGIPSYCRVKLSFDTWFSLLPPIQGVRPGGILFGEQSEALTKRTRTPAQHAQFVQVDTQKNLYCSLFQSYKTPVATDLEYNRWYHLALTYDGYEESVFLDGVLVNTKFGRFIPWMRLKHAQIGTGFESDNRVGSSSADCNGWYGFHGVIHAFRFWEHALTADEAATLAGGGSLDKASSFSLLHVPKDKIMGRVKRIRSSSPVERVYRTRKQRHKTSCTIS